ncbi:glucan biosynthesis protein, periplasmic [Verrucomicrobia bacterium]|nr:glucan biosynthesis protein, periplasmic [Verrucomicrobiota bacterium]
MTLGLALGGAATCLSFVLRPSTFVLVSGLVLAWGIACLGGTPASEPSSPSVTAPFSFESLRLRARQMAAQAYHRPSAPDLPDFLKKLSWADYQAIRFRPEQAPWHGEGLPFQLGFVHRGGLFQDAVRIHLLVEGQVHDFLFVPEQFDYGGNHFPKPVPPDLNFAGLRVLYGFEPHGQPQEVASFLGASFFRLAGEHQRLGAAARGLAIDTAEPNGEEFPQFTEFWIERPPKQAKSLQLYALLDSPSVAGAYHFVLKPGETTVMALEASLFLRKEIKKPGFAALTSMFLVGQNRTRFIPDYRPQVHDSDGLLFHGPEGEWVWRPLVNPPKTHRLTEFPLTDPEGFGLEQRDRNFYDYEDLANRYELRPSLWVVPQGKWGQGRIELVEIPSPAENNDNIVAYWIPQQKPVPGHEFHWACSLSAGSAEESSPTLLHVLSTRIAPEHEKIPPLFVIDFGGPPPTWLASKAPVAGKTQASSGEVKNLVTEKNEVTGGWRVSFNLEAAAGQPVQIRAWLRSEGHALSETWVYDLENP